MMHDTAGPFPFRPVAAFLAFFAFMTFTVSETADFAVARAAAAQITPQKGFVFHDKPRPVPEIRFENGDGKTMSLADFRGKVVLLNIWATWCSPCRREMPTLDQLQARLGGPAFEVVALSIDRAGMKVVEAFYREIGIRHLRKYLDKNNKAMLRLFVTGIPTTLLIDKKGREVGRLVGPAEWDSPGIVKIIEGIIAGRNSSRSFERKYARDVADLNDKAPTIRRKHRHAVDRPADGSPIITPEI